MAHALLSPSSAERWMTCPGSVALTKDMEDTSSSFADEGTLAHAVGERSLRTGIAADGYVGLTGEDLDLEVALYDEVTPEMVRFVNVYTTLVWDLVGEGADKGELHVEVELDISGLTGEEGAHGTADALIVHADELIVVDLKYGMGVAVEAEENSQLMIYGLAALQLYELSHDIKRVRLVICQPRLHSVSEWTISVEDLRAFGTKVALAAAIASTDNAPLVPSPKGCRWCKAKATCPALREQAMADFEDVAPATAEDQVLADCMSKVPMIEAWLKAIRAEVERRLLAGDKVPGYKLVQGKRGARKWANVEEAEAALKAMRVPHDRMYDYSLVSPTTVEKLHAEGIVGPRQWPKLQPLITQSEGSPSVAPESDKRPAITVTSASASDFDDVTALA